MSERQSIRIAVLGDDPLARAGLAALVASETGLVVATQLALRDAGFAAREQVRAAVWDAARIGTGAAGLDPDLPFPTLALVTDAPHAGLALAAGARGVLFRDTGAERIGVAVRALVEGFLVLEEALAPEGLRHHGAATEPILGTLTRREIEVLQLLARGLSNRRIAASLGISEHTAKFHVNAILGKLGAAGRTEAVVRAARLGLVVL
jgi:DNA-binding NarL/FixJ family response regulator